MTFSDVRKNVSWYLPGGIWSILSFVMLFLFSDLVWSVILRVPPLIDGFFSGVITAIGGIIKTIVTLLVIIYGPEKMGLSCGFNCSYSDVYNIVGGKYEYWFGAITGLIKSLGWWAFIIWVVLKYWRVIARPLSHFPVVGTFFKRLLEKNPKKKHKRTFIGLKTFGIAPIIQWLRSKDSWYTKWFAKLWTRIENHYINNTLPFAFRQLRAELMMHMNYMTRLHTYFGKMGAVEEAVNKASAIEENFSKTGKTYQELSISLDNMRYGKDEKDESGETSYGWGNNILLVDSKNL